MQNLFYSCVRGDESPTVIILTQATYILLVRALTATLNYYVQQQPTARGDVSFEHVYFHGIPVVFDAYTPAQRGYFLNLKYMKFLVNENRDMTMREFITPSDQDALIGRIYWSGNLVCSNLARQGLLQGLPDTAA